MCVRQRWFVALIVLAIGAPFAPAQASLALTAAGIADGFTLTNFLSLGGGYTFLGSANLPDGTLAVGGNAQNKIYQFNDLDGQTLANALKIVDFGGEIDLANAGGQAYAASQNAGFWQVANDLTLTKIITNPLVLPTPAMEGLAGNPVTGNLIATSSLGLINLDPTTGNNKVIISNPPSLADGVTVSPDGNTAYVAIFGGSEVLGYDISTGTLVFSAMNLPDGPDGIAVISGGAFNGDIVVNNNGVRHSSGTFDGSVGLLDVKTGIETIIASGGTRGDFASPDLNNGSLLLYEDDSVWRLALAGSCIGAPCPGGGGGPGLPEPATLVLLSTGLLSLGWMRRRRVQA
jgi:DNA-binding beta-propeller fold protein YncE